MALYIFAFNFYVDPVGLRSAF